MFKKAILVIFMSFNISAEDSITIEIDISKQRLFLLNNMEIIRSYPISSSKYGEGSTQNSFKTPLGNHVIKEMIGRDAIKNTIFTSRINTKRQADIIHDLTNSDNDYVTTRIMWLMAWKRVKIKERALIHTKGTFIFMERMKRV